jgi:hypothetical protein
VSRDTSIETEVLRRDPEASTAAALWRTRRQATVELYDEVERLRGDGYMLAEIARACGTDAGALRHLLRVELTERRYHGDPA